MSPSRYEVKKKTSPCLTYYLSSFSSEFKLLEPYSLGYPYWFHWRPYSLAARTSTARFTESDFNQTGLAIEKLKCCPVEFRNLLSSMNNSLHPHLSLQNNQVANMSMIFVLHADVSECPRTTFLNDVSVAERLSIQFLIGINRVKWPSFFLILLSYFATDPQEQRLWYRYIQR